MDGSVRWKTLFLHFINFSIERVRPDFRCRALRERWARQPTLGRSTYDETDMWWSEMKRVKWKKISVIKLQKVFHDKEKKFSFSPIFPHRHRESPPKPSTRAKWRASGSRLHPGAELAPQRKVKNLCKSPFTPMHIERREKIGTHTHSHMWADTTPTSNVKKKNLPTTIPPDPRSEQEEGGRYKISAQ